MSSPPPIHVPHRSPLLPVSLATLVCLAVAAPWIISSAVAVLGVDATTPMEWVPETFPPRRAYDQFTREFESGDVEALGLELRLGHPQHALGQVAAADSQPQLGHRS